eukprot:280169_1
MMKVLLALIAFYQIASGSRLLLTQQHNCISPGVVYAIYSVSSGQYLDGRSTSYDNPLLGYKDQDPNNIGWTFVDWNVIQLNNGYYALKSVSSGKYLDGRNPNYDNPLLSNQDQDPNYIQSVLDWSFVPTNGPRCACAILSVSSSKYLDGRSASYNNPLLGYRNAFTTTNPFIQWQFVPLNYKLNGVISDFDFGNENDIENILDTNKQVAFIDSKTIVAAAVGITVSGEYGEKIQESFAFGFSQTIGVGIETEIQAGIPLIGSATVTVSASFEFSASQEWTTTQEKDFRTGYSFKPEEIGIYEVGMMCYVVRDQALPFTASVFIIGKTDDIDETSYTGNQIASILQYRGSDVTITEIGSNYVKATITGSVRASFGVNTNTYSERIGDIPPQEM